MIRTTLAASAACLMLATPATAATAFEFEFSFDKARVQTEDGARAVHEELSARIARECKTRPGSRRLADLVMERNCHERTLQEAVSRIGSAALDRVHENQAARR